MPFCPACATDYPAGSKCPKHGGLIRRLYKKDRSMDDPLVRVATAWSEPIAQSWAELLRNNGIPSIVKAAGPGFSLGAPLPFGFPIYLLVPASLFARGHAILEGYEEPGELELEPVGDAAG